jgi:hypothetical protein
MLRKAIAARTLVTVGLLCCDAQAAPFADASGAWLANVTADGGWSNKVELCDIDGDGALDALVANGAAYNAPDAPERPAHWRNAGDHFVDVDVDIDPGWWRVVKCADVDNDGDLDVFFGGTYQSQSVLLKNTDGALSRDDDALPPLPLSLGDAEFADVDGDLDLDLVVADWGDGDPFFVRGRPRLFINDGAGAFVDDSDARLPTARTGFSWDLEAVDVDDDTDLDLLVSCKSCSDGGLLFENDGDGHFLDVSGLLPGAGNNYEFEVIDIDDDGDLDLFTINDDVDLGERVLENQGGHFAPLRGAFADVANGDDDNAALVVDVDGDDDLDVLVGSLSGSDRVFVNDGGVFVDVVVAVDADDTPGTLGVALGDLDDDGRLDLVMGQGEAAFDERVFLGDEIAADTLPPRILRVAVDAAHGRLVARVHDRVTPARPGDLVVVARVLGQSGTRTVPLTAAGELLWAGPLAGGDLRATVCATDRGGREACADAVDVSAVNDNGGDDDDDLALSGGGCRGAGAALVLPFLPLLPLSWRRRASLRQSENR